MSPPAPLGRTRAARGREAAGRVVAVLEVGSTSIRMAVAQIDAANRLDTLEALQQTVTLGKDTFTRGFIGSETTEACVRVLKSFRRVLEEYHVTDSRQIMAVATSAVREATNRDAFLDRIFIATGIDVDPIDEAEVTRFTCLAVRSLFDAQPSLRKGNLLVVEVGGGSTEALLFRDGQLRSSHTYRLGSLRLRQRVEDHRASARRMLEIMKTQVDMAVAEIRASVAGARPLQLLVLGGDARFAASLSHPDWARERVARLGPKEFQRVAGAVLEAPVDDLVRQHHLSFADAETLGPALLIYARLAKALGARVLHVGAATLRDGVLTELHCGGSWTELFHEEIIHSALELGRKFHFDPVHAQYVADLARQFFATLKDEHRLDQRCELILTVAALLHNIGLYVSNRSHHKHSMYLIQNSEIFGMGAKDLLLTALVARYHRRALPNPLHEGFSSLDRDGRITVSKLAAILRVADAIGRGYGRAAHRVQARVEPGQLAIAIDKPGDLAMERQGLREKAHMFEQVYGMQVVLEGG